MTIIQFKKKQITMFEQVKQEIDDKIKTNGNNEITATRLNSVLQDMMDAAAEEIENVAMQPVSGAHENNFASFDANGGIKDSGCNEGTFIKGVQQNGVDLQKDANGKVNVTVQDGEDGLSAFEIAQQQGYTGTVDQWLASLKANIGEYLFVPTDAAAVTAMATIGQTYPSAIDPNGKNVAPTQDTLSVILLMNDDDTTPSKTMMIATQEVTPSTTPASYEFVYAGDLQSAMPSNVVTEDDIDNSFAGGNYKVAGAEEVKTLREETPRIIADENTESFNIIDEDGNIFAQIDENGLKTKNFDSSEVVESPTIGIENTEEVVIIDDNYNILARIDKDGIKTKNFDSKEISNKIGKVTLQNSDIITILGSSFGETEAFPTNKHWSGIMSMFSDYRIQNLSQGGSNVVSNLYFIRSGYWNVQGKYVVITNNENISTLDITKYINGLDNLCTTLIGMGKIPIVCTNYHKSQLMSMAIEKYAYEHNLMFWDCSKYCSSLTSGIYAGFDDGAHLRKRNAPMVAYAYLNHLLKMGKPFTSIKVFDIRDNSFSGSLDNLVFSNNTERAKLFKEIKISSTSNLDEYNKLISNTAVSFDKYGLVEITIPSVSKYVEYLKLNLNTNETGVKVYIKNTNVSPYPNTSAASTIRFSVSNTINIPSLGDVYSNGGVNYTVQSVVMGENNYYCTIYCSPSTMPSSQTGTLSVVSQVSGSTGSSSIPFVMAEEVVLDLSAFIVADNKGHWVELSGTDNSFEVPSNLFNGSIQIDKLSFLIEATSLSFQLKDVNLDYRISELKDVKPNKEFVWYENDFLHTDELLPETTFGTVGTTTSHWKDGNGNGIVSIADYEQKYPAGATSMINVSDTLSMNIAVSSSILNKFGDMYLEIYCRYFPSAPTPYSQANDTNVNNSSFDFNTLFIKCGSNYTFSGPNTAILTEEIGLYWKIVRIPICWFINPMSGVNNLYLSLYSNSNGIEVCKVSLKYKD